MLYFFNKIFGKEVIIYYLCSPFEKWVNFVMFFMLKTLQEKFLENMGSKRIKKLKS